MSPREQNKTKHVKSKWLNLIPDFLLFNSVTLNRSLCLLVSLFPDL